MLSEEDKKRVGGSDVAAIAGVSPYASAYAVWERIVNGVEREATAHTGRGTRLEPVVLDWYEEAHRRRVVRNVALRDGRRPHLRGSLDGLSWSGDDSPARPVEVKTANGSQAHRWGDEGTDQIPEEYLAQTHWYLGLGRETRGDVDEVADVPALIAGDFRLYTVTYDAEVYGMLSEAVDRFWTDHVLTGKPPKPTALPNDAEAIRRRFRRHEGDKPLDFAALTPEQQVTLEEYIRAYQEESAAAERLATLEARAKLVVGTAPGVSGLPEALGFHRLDWRQSKGRAVTDWDAIVASLKDEDPEMQRRVAALIQQHTTTREGARPFTPRAITKGKR